MMSLVDPDVRIRQGWPPGELSARCMRCGFSIGAETAPLDGCPRCRESGVGTNLTLDVPAAPGMPLVAEPAAAGVWKYAPRIPVAAPQARVCLGEGGTPLVALEHLSARPAGALLWAKDESVNPTLSFKDRFMAAAVSRARDSEAEVVVVSSTGNGAASAAAYAARARLRCVVLAPPQLPGPPERQVRALGAELVAVPDGLARWRLMRAAVESWGWYPLSNNADPPNGSNLFGIAGYKTIAYEIFSSTLAPEPQWVVVPLSMGDALFGIWQGFEELRRMGLLDRVPRMVGVEPEVAAPVSAALSAGVEHPVPVAASTSVAYNIGSSRGSEQAMIALRASAGRALAMPEAEILPFRARVAAECGIYAEASSVPAIWGACQVAGAGEAAVAVVTSSGLKDPRVFPRPDPLDPISPTLEDLADSVPPELLPA